MCTLLPARNLLREDRELPDNDADGSRRRRPGTRVPLPGGRRSPTLQAVEAIDTGDTALCGQASDLCDACAAICLSPYHSPQPPPPGLAARLHCRDAGSPAPAAATGPPGRRGALSLPHPPTPTPQPGLLAPCTTRPTAVSLGPAVPAPAGSSLLTSPAPWHLPADASPGGDPSRLLSLGEWQPLPPNKTPWQLLSGTQGLHPTPSTPRCTSAARLTGRASLCP